MFKLFLDVNDRSCYSSHTTSSTAATIFRSRSFPASSTMAKGRRPPPLNLSIDARPRSLPRVSRTPILICKESTPLLTPLPEDDYEDPPEAIVRVVRIAIDFMHLVACMMLAIIVAIFLVTYTKPLSSSFGPGAMLLLSALVSDIVLDVRSIRLNDRSWSEWALLARTLAASAYLGILISFLATDRVFPADYTYWNMTPTEGGGPVVGLVCVVLGWDIVHLILSQNRAGWWWTWLQEQCRRRPSRITGRGNQHIRGGRASMRAMRAWSCAS